MPDQRDTLSVQRVIAAPADRIFDVIADPRVTASSTVRERQGSRQRRTEPAFARFDLPDGDEERRQLFDAQHRH